MTKHRVRLLILSILLSFSTSTSQEIMKIFFNGHDYQIPNVFADSIRKAFAAQRPAMESLLKQYVEAEGGTSVNVWILPEISVSMSQKTFANIPNGHLGSGELLVTFSRATIHFNWGSSCRIEAELMMRMTANIDIVVTDSSYQLRTSNVVMSGDVDAEGHSIKPWLFFWYEWACDGVQNVFETVATFEFASTFKSMSTNIKQDIFSYKKSGLGGLPVAEAVQAFPIKFTFGSTVLDTVITYYQDPNFYFGWLPALTPRYVPFIGFDFMEGTASNPTAFVGIQPPTVTNPSLDHIGFGNPYGQFQGLNESETSIINKMRELGTHSIRFHVPWRDVVGPLTYNSSLNPANLTETEINNLANDDNKWDSTDAIIDHALSNKMDVILQLAQGHTYKHERVIPAIQGFTIAPDSSRTGSSVDSVFYVNENFYLYHLKLFANAAVKRYANRISIWTIEGELNAAKLNHLANLWRFGNKWADESPGGFQDKVWGILRDAVRQRDPSAKLSTVFHMLNIVKGLQRFGPDVDIVGVNAYPNLGFATPVLGMAVGEMVWATRRALTGLGMGSKEVYVTETNYPGIQASDPPSGISIKDDMDYYSYNRQKQFMADAIESATNYGAKGFFWWMFVAKDVKDDNIDSETGFGGIVKPNLQFKQPASTEFNQKLQAKHPGKASVRLLNKSGSNPNVGGMISLYGQRDMLASGDTVAANRNRTHNSRTEQQLLGGLKHLNWNTPAQFRLKEPFTIGSGETFLERAAIFASTSATAFAVKVGGTSIASNVYLGDPWYVDQNGYQPGNLLTAIQGGMNANVFLGQNPTQDPTIPIYRIHANQDVEHNRVIYNFQNWTYSNATVPQPTSLQSNIIFNSSASVTANYVALKPLPPANISMVATAGQKVKYTWTEPPDANVTQYKIWRKTKTQEPIFVGFVNRGTTLFTDFGTTVSNGPGSELIFYDIKSYYAPNGSVSDDSWHNVTGVGGPEPERIVDQTIEINQIPGSFGIFPFPNPFNPSTTFAYQLPKPAFVTLEIYDITGRLISELINAQLSQGYHSIKWDGTGWASGIYLYRFTARAEGMQDVFLRTGKLVLTK